MKEYATHVLELDLTIARTNTFYPTGLMNALLVDIVQDSNADMKIRFDLDSNQAIPIQTGDKYHFSEDESNARSEFEGVYITNDAVGDGIARLIFSRNVEIERLLRVTADIAQEGILQQVVTVGVVATAIPTASLDNRVNVLLYNPVGGNTVYIGSSTVTTAGATQGIPLLAGASLSLNVAQGITIYGIAAIAQDINVLEGA